MTSGRRRAVAGVAFLVSVLIARTAVAREVSSNGPLAMRAPADLVAGVDTALPIVLKRPATDDIRLVSSVGRVGPLEIDGDLRRATITLPDDRRPQLVIVAAVGTSGVVDWLIVPMSGRGRVRVTTEPRARVVLRVAGRAFGPVSADRSGLALVDVEVPPGELEGEAVAADVAGNVTTQTIPLAPPPLLRVLAVCLTDRVVFATSTARGDGVSAEPPLVSSSTGSASVPRRLAPGLFEITLDPGEAAADVATVRGAMTTDGPSSHCDLPVPPEPPSSLSLILDHDEYSAGSGAPIMIAVRPVYAGRRRPLVPEIDMTVDAGSVMPGGAGGDRFTWVWRPPDELGGRSVLHARATVRGMPAVSGDAVIALRAGISVSLAVTSARLELPGDGVSSTEIRIRASDRFGNLARPGPLRPAQATVGQLGPFSPVRPDGTVTAVYTAPRSYASGHDTIMLVDAHGASGRLDIRWSAMPRRFSASARVGYLSNLGRLSTAAFLADGWVRLGQSRLLVGAEIGTYAGELRVEEAGGALIRAQVRVVPLSARVAYEVATDRGSALVGVSLGVLATHARVSSEASGEASNRSWPVAPGAFLRLQVPVWRGRALGEVAGAWARIDEPTLGGQIGGVSFTLGYGLER